MPYHEADHTRALSRIAADLSGLDRFALATTIKIDGRDIHTTEDRLIAAQGVEGVRRGYIGSVAGEGLLCIVSDGIVWKRYSGLRVTPRLFETVDAAQQALDRFHEQHSGVGHIAIAISIAAQ